MKRCFSAVIAKGKTARRSLKNEEPPAAYGPYHRRQAVDKRPALHPIADRFGGKATRTGVSGQGCFSSPASILPVLSALLALFLSISVRPEMVQAESRVEEKTIRDLIIRLDKEYKYLDEELRKLRERVKGFPGTTLSITVTKHDPDLRLLSLELRDNERPLRSHIYSTVENKALNAGGRQQFYLGEVAEGAHKLKAVYYWTEGDGPPRSGETVITLSVKPAVSYYVELSFHKKGNKVELLPYGSEFRSR